MNKTNQNLLNSKLIWLYITNMGILLMESFIIALWYQELIPTNQLFTFLFLVIFFTALFSFSIARSFQKVKLKKWLINVFFVVWIILILGLTQKLIFYYGIKISLSQLYFQPFLNLFLSLDNIFPLLHVFIFLLILVRSLWLSTQVIDSNTVQNSIKFGVVLFFVYGLFFQNNFSSTNVLVFLLYCLIALFTLSSSRVVDLAYKKGGQLPPFSKSWFLTLLIISMFILLIGLFSGWFLGTQVSNLIIIIFFIFIGVLLFFGMLIAAPFIFIINILINIFSQAITNNVTPQEQEIQILENPLTEAVLENIDNLDTLLQAPGIGKFLLIAAVFIVLVFYILNFLTQKPWRNPNLNNWSETYDIQKERSNHPKNNFPGFQLGYKQLQKWMLKNRIRKLYFSFLEKCDQLEIPRKKYETPFEFQSRIILILPNFVSEIKIITNLYNQIRYGMLPESEKELQAANSAWRKFKDIDKNQLTKSE